MIIPPTTPHLISLYCGLLGMCSLRILYIALVQVYTSSTRSCASQCSSSSSNSRPLFTHSAAIKVISLHWTPVMFNTATFIGNEGRFMLQTLNHLPLVKSIKVMCASISVLPAGSVSLTESASVSQKLCCFFNYKLVWLVFLYFFPHFTGYKVAANQ